MSWDDFKTPIKTEKIKDITIGGTPHYFYCIFRIGNKLKVVDGNMKATLNTIKAFQKHMERQQETPNANEKIENEILIGDKNIYAKVYDHIKDVKMRKNGVLARELLMTASPDFFKNMMPGELEKWKTDNIDFLEKTFGDNCVYATLHLDESTPHIHALIVPKIKNKKGEYILSNKHYFNGIEAYREFQDHYSEKMKEHFKILNRGIRFSKAKHLTIRQYYTLINQKININDKTQLEAKAKNNDLLEIKIKAIEKTLNLYKNSNSKNERKYDKAIIEAKELVKAIDNLKANKQRYKEELSHLSQQYKVPQYLIDNIIKECEQINNKEQEREI